METPTVLVERERERVTGSPSFPRRHKILFGIIVAVGIIVYAAFNVWVYQYSKSGKAPSLDAIRQAVLKGDSLPFKAQGKPQGDTFPSVIPANAGIQSTITSTPSPTPTPRPTGPGKFACDPLGNCNVYSDEMRRQYCATTYADSRCLDQCGDKENQCKK